MNSRDGAFLFILSVAAITGDPDVEDGDRGERAAEGDLEALFVFGEVCQADASSKGIGLRGERGVDSLGLPGICNVAGRTRASVLGGTGGRPSSVPEFANENISGSFVRTGVRDVMEVTFVLVTLSLDGFADDKRFTVDRCLLSLNFSKLACLLIFCISTCFGEAIFNDCVPDRNTCRNSLGSTQLARLSTVLNLDSRLVLACSFALRILRTVFSNPGGALENALEGLFVLVFMVSRPGSGSQGLRTLADSVCLYTVAALVFALLVEAPLLGIFK